MNPYREEGEIIPDQNLHDILRYYQHTTRSQNVTTIIALHTRTHELEKLIEQQKEHIQTLQAALNQTQYHNNQLQHNYNQQVEWNRRLAILLDRLSETISPQERNRPTTTRTSQPY